MLCLGLSVRSVRSLVSGRAQSTLAAAAQTKSAAAQEKPAAWNTAKPFDTIPGPKPLPLIGNTWRFIPGIGDFANAELGKLIPQFLERYGKIARLGGIMGRRDIIMLFDPIDVETVFRNEGAWPERMSLESFVYYREVLRKDFFKDAGGLISTQGEEWGKFRTTVNQPMMQPRVAKNYIAPIDDVALDLVNRIPGLKNSEAEMPADFINELYKWALESIAMIALDTRLGCLQPILAADSEPQLMINSVHKFFDCMYKLDMKVPIWKLISTPSWRQYVKSSDYIRETGMKYVNQTLERLKKSPPGQDQEMSILEKILARNPNPKVACVMAVDMMMAGIDTTSHTVGFLLHHLATNPDKQQKLHEEIDRVLSKTRITDQNLNDMKYLKACLKESMRITPVAVGNSRTTNKDMVLQGYQVPKGTDLMMGHQAMNMLEVHYPQPTKFLPERWLKGEAERKTHPFVTMPFGFGTRMCVGRRFAELEVEVLVSRILQQYRLEWHYGPMATESKLLNMCKSPLKFKMIDRTTA